VRIEFEASGGYGGLRLSYRGDIEELPSAEAKELMDLIEASDIFHLKQSQLSQKSRSIPDDFACRLSLVKAGKKKTLSFNELSVPENVRRLSVHLRKLAIQKRGK
jgi:hypothetical protein